MTLIRNFLKTIKARGLKIALNATFQHTKGLFLKLKGQDLIKKDIYDYKMYLDLNDRGISRALLLFGNRELEHKYILEKILKPEMNVLDIGANIGYYALMELNLIGRNGKLIAVEPSKTNVSLLRKNLKLNSKENVEIHEAAISDKNSIKEFHLSSQSNLNTFHNIGTGVEHLSGETINVNTMTLEKVLGGRKVNLIRMDVEGHEVEILNSLVNSYEKIIKKPMVLFETHLSRYNEEHNFQKTLNDLFKLGYYIDYLGSSSENGTSLINNLGYKSIKEIKTDGDKRSIFRKISTKDAIDLICKTGGIRTVLLCPPN